MYIVVKRLKKFLEKKFEIFFHFNRKVYGCRQLIYLSSKILKITNKNIEEHSRAYPCQKGRLKQFEYQRPHQMVQLKHQGSNDRKVPSQRTGLGLHQY